MSICISEISFLTPRDEGIYNAEADTSATVVNDRNRNTLARPFQKLQGNNRQDIAPIASPGAGWYGFNTGRGPDIRFVGQSSLTVNSKHDSKSNYKEAVSRLKRPQSTI